MILLYIFYSLNIIKNQQIFVRWYFADNENRWLYNNIFLFDYNRFSIHLSHKCFCLFFRPRRRSGSSIVVLGGDSIEDFIKSDNIDQFYRLNDGTYRETSNELEMLTMMPVNQENGKILLSGRHFYIRFKCPRRVRMILHRILGPSHNVWPVLRKCVSSAGDYGAIKQTREQIPERHHGQTEKFNHGMFQWILLRYLSNKFRLIKSTLLLHNALDVYN